MHGMGDSGSNPGMKELCNSVHEKYGNYVLCLDVSNGLLSIANTMDEQLAELHNVVQKHYSYLKGGFNAIGNSQGGLLMRAYVERYNDPPVKTFISWTGVQNGIHTCPLGSSALCYVWGVNRIINPYTFHIVFSDYWKDSRDKARYLRENRFLPDINNENPNADLQNPMYKRFSKGSFERNGSGTIVVTIVTMKHATVI